MNRNSIKKPTQSLIRIKSFNVLEELVRTKIEIANCFSPSNSVSTTPTHFGSSDIPKKKSQKSKKELYTKLPPISIHRNPMSILSGREIGYE